MSMPQVPTRSLVFMAHTARYGAQLGLKKGVAKAAAKAVPPLLVAEAAFSVFEAIHSYIKLREARVIRDGLAEELVHLEEELRLKRAILEEDIETARQAVAHRQEVSEAMAGLVRVTQQAFSMAMDGLAELRNADLPDLAELDARREEIEDAWAGFRQALQLYQSQSIIGGTP